MGRVEIWCWEIGGGDIDVCGERDGGGFDIVMKKVNAGIWGRGWDG